MTTSPRPTSDERASEAVAFDDACDNFTERMKCLAGWKHNFFGAAYSTRIRAAIAEGRRVFDEMEKVLEADNARGQS